jgi:hypothetical protein
VCCDHRTAVVTALNDLRNAKGDRNKIIQAARKAGLAVNDLVRQAKLVAAGQIDPAAKRRLQNYMQEAAEAVTNLGNAIKDVRLLFLNSYCWSPIEMKQIRLEILRATFFARFIFLSFKRLFKILTVSKPNKNWLMQHKDWTMLYSNSPLKQHKLQHNKDYDFWHEYDFHPSSILLEVTLLDTRFSFRVVLTFYLRLR